MARVAVVGSVNMDLVIRASKLPEVGETITGGWFATFPGGKGANQAVASARLGAAVAMVGRVGSDSFGAQLRQGLTVQGIDATLLLVEPDVPTGVALITVDSAGRNTIVVAPGANARVSPADVETARRVIAASQVLALQLEIPLETVVRATHLAEEAGCRVILDPAPAPAFPLPEDLYRKLTVINPNEVEAKALTGIAVDTPDGLARAAAWFLARGCAAAVIKLGERGAFLATPAFQERVPAIPVDPVDTTAAGDAFAGALAAALAAGKRVDAAVRFANVAAAISVTRMGAQPSLPTLEEVGQFARARGIQAGI